MYWSIGENKEDEPTGYFSNETNKESWKTNVEKYLIIGLLMIVEGMTMTNLT